MECEENLTSSAVVDFANGSITTASSPDINQEKGIERQSNMFSSPECKQERTQAVVERKRNVQIAGEVKSQRRVAFTLAEVLITLGIIGVVAAMTLPTLIRNYEEHVTVNKVKKFYSMINQAYLQSVNDNGYANEWHVDNGYTAVTANQLAGYIKPYLKISKDCGTSTNKCLGYQNNIKLLNKSNYMNYDSDSRYYKIILHDGSYLWFRAATDTYCAALDGGYSDSCGAFWYDVNGNKGLNTFGVDVFVFYFTPTGIKPSYSKINSCVRATGQGWSCARYILEHGDMKYLH